MEIKNKNIKEIQELNDSIIKIKREYQNKIEILEKENNEKLIKNANFSTLVLR